jgi:hypothetical protein
VQFGSDVVVRQADVTDERAGRIAIFVRLETVWARIAARLGSRSTGSLESNAYTATVREGLIGAQQQEDAFVCWTRSGALATGPVDGGRVAQGSAAVSPRPGRAAPAPRDFARGLLGWLIGAETFFNVSCTSPLLMSPTVEPSRPSTRSRVVCPARRRRARARI